MKRIATALAFAALLASCRTETVTPAVRTLTYTVTHYRQAAALDAAA